MFSSIKAKFGGQILRFLAGGADKTVCFVFDLNVSRGVQPPAAPQGTAKISHQRAANAVFVPSRPRPLRVIHAVAPPAAV